MAFPSAQKRHPRHPCHKLSFALIDSQVGLIPITDIVIKTDLGIDNNFISVLYI